MKKAAIELSLNFIVIIIISAVIMAMGVGIVTKFVIKGQEIVDELDANAKRQISSRLQQGERVVILDKNVKLTKGKQYIVGMGIFNLGADISEPKDNIFFVHLVTKYKDPETGEINPYEDNSVKDPYILQPQFSQEYNIDNNAINDNIGILFKPKNNAKRGMYIIHVHVCRARYIRGPTPNYIDINGPDDCDSREKTYTRQIFKIYAEVK